MADDDQPKTDSDSDPPGDIDTPNAPVGGYPQADSQPADQPPEKPEETLNESRRKAYIEQLEKNYYESANRGQKMFGQMQGALQDLLKLQNVPVPQLQQTAMPPPPTEQQKGGLSEFVFNLLKFGALTAVAYGVSGRGYGHNALYKAALGAALTGYATGRKDVTNASMKLWEKNREIINDANKEQNANYRAILQDHRMDLQQKMDIINKTSAMYGDYRTFTDSQNRNLMDLQKSLNDQEKVQRDKEEFEIKNREKVYEAIGEKNVNDGYLAWLLDQSGGKVKLTKNSPAEDWYQVEKDHPEWSFSAWRAWKEKEDVRVATEKARAVAQTRQDVKGDKDKQPQSDPEAAKRAAKILEGLTQ